MTVAARGTLSSLVEDLFEAGPSAQPDGSLGAELELIPVRQKSRERVGIGASRTGLGTADVAREVARTKAWREETDPYGAPSWLTPGGGRLCYEPGGQLEICSPVFQSANELGSYLIDTVASFRDVANGAGIDLLACGVDPYNDLDDVPAQLHAPRYDAMARHFNAIGPSGARMMRQTASLQLSVELGPDAIGRWTLLNALAPYVVAAFANSRRYAGADTGYASYRARLWRTLDVTRTGIPFDASDPTGAYTAFARDAERILTDDAAHLTTLFPEVRPRHYFELRSMDAMEPDSAAHAIRFVSALIHDPDIAAEALAVAGAPDISLLERASVLGRQDALLHNRLCVLESLAEQSRSAREPLARPLRHS